MFLGYIAWYESVTAAQNVSKITQRSPKPERAVGEHGDMDLRGGEVEKTLTEVKSIIYVALRTG